MPSKAELDDFRRTREAPAAWRACERHTDCGAIALGTCACRVGRLSAIAVTYRMAAYNIIGLPPPSCSPCEPPSRIQPSCEEGLCTITEAETPPPGSLDRAIGIISDDDSVCRIDGQERRGCWGEPVRDDEGAKLGARHDRSIREMEGIGQVSGVFVGDDHRCARALTGKVYCWGSNEHGQLGAGEAVTISKTPVEVALPSKAHFLTVGPHHSCATTRRWVLCWGRNTHGQLGDGTTVDRARPTPVMGVTNPGRIVAGRGFTCASENNGHVLCWGLNDRGQLGDGTRTNKTRPGFVLREATTD